MHTTHLKNIPLAHGEITLVTASTAESVIEHSWMLASESQRLGVGALLINCGISKRRFTLGDPRDHSAPIKSPNNAQLMVHCSNRGDLVGEANEIIQLVRDCKIGVVILSSWEWSSSSYTRSRRLQFMLLELAESEDVAIVVYTQTATKPVAGKMDRGGTGRLAAAVFAVANLDGVNDSVSAVPKPAPVVAHSTQERDAMNATVLEATQLLANESKGLRGDVVRNGHLPVQDSLRTPSEAAPCPR